MGKKTTSRNRQEIDQKTFQAIFTSATEGIFVCDDTGKILVANPIAHSIFGYKRDELTGKKIENLIPRKIREGHKAHRKSFHKNPKPRKMGAGRDLVGLKKNGKEIPIEVSLSYSKINGQAIAIAFVIDITVRKSAEDAIKKEKESTQMYLDVAGSIFLVVDTQNKIKLINPMGCEVLGVKDQNELIGKNWLEYIEASERKDIKKRMKACINSKQSSMSSFESRLISANNAGLIIYWQTAIIRDKGKPVACLFSGVDITDRKKAEESLRKSEEKLILYATELEKRVQKRTLQLADSVNNLEQINKELGKEIMERKKAEEEARVALEKQKELNELKSRFVSMASHEFRTPLSTILSSAALISKYEKEDMQDKRMKHVNRIKDNVYDLTGILNDFLSLEKLEGGKIDIIPETIDLINFTKEVTDELKLITKSNQSIEFRSNKEAYEIQMDRGMLKNILNNLISNAIKYSPEGSVIDVEANANKSGVQIKFIDRGMGIPETDQIHLFTRFFRAKNATNIQGTGLGLNLVKRYLDLAGGKIWFESKEGKGSTFYITIPRVNKHYEKNTIN